MTDLPPMWKDMTPEEKGAILLDEYEGREIQRMSKYSKTWVCKYGPCYAPTGHYRTKPEPVRETVTLYGRSFGQYGWVWNRYRENTDTHVLTYKTRDGEPVNGTFQVQRIGE